MGQQHNRGQAGQSKNGDPAIKGSSNPASAKASRIAESGVTTRVRGHISAHGRRSQGKRDSRPRG